MAGSRQNAVFMMLMGIVILLMIAIAGLFVRMNQLQSEVLAAFRPLQTANELGGLAIGTIAPGFTLLDSNGQGVSLSDFAGRQVLLEFSSTHCPACKALYGNLRSFSSENQGIQVIMVSQGTTDEIRQLAAELGFPVLVWEDSVAVEYQVMGTPFFYFIDPSGKVVDRGHSDLLRTLADRKS